MPEKQNHRQNTDCRYEDRHDTWLFPRLAIFLVPDITLRLATVATLSRRIVGRLVGHWCAFLVGASPAQQQR